MWSSFRLIGWQSLWQNVSYRHLAIALLISFLLHLFLIGQFYAKSANMQDERGVIEARLVLPPVVLSKELPAKPILKNAVNPRKTSVNKTVSKKVAPTPEALVIEEPAPVVRPSLSDATPVVNKAEPTVQEAKVSDAEASQDVKSDQVPVPDDKKIEEAGVVINPNAYRYVETEFDVRTEITEKVDSSAAGKAKIVYQLLSNSEQYHLTSLIQAKGLAALLIPDLLQVSDGFLNNAGLQPEHYLYQFGNKKNKTFNVDFDWEHKQLQLHSANGEQIVELPEGTQDLLSFMYQFMFVAPLQNMQLSITNGKKISTYVYSFEGEETIATKMGKLATIHLLRVGAEGEKKTELWLALDYQYVPVKIRETEKQGKVYELLASSIKTKLPTPPVP
jgi:hypothetical protein